MPTTQRSSDVVEIFSERAMMSGIGGVIGLVISGVLIAFRGEGALLPFAIIVGLGSLAAVGYAGYQVYLARQVPSVDIKCSFCNATNKLIETPKTDVTCVECHRLIPIRDGVPMAVHQVRCGYCNELNYYSDKTEVLLCESCNRDIPISQADGHAPTKRVAAAYAPQVQDPHLYELVLVAHGNKTDELISTLQHMLALNRNQVKQILMELPSTLLTGIPKRKAEMLAAQLATHDGLTEVRQLPDGASVR